MTPSAAPVFQNRSVRMASGRPFPLFRNLMGKVAAIPMALAVAFVFVGGTLWTVHHAFTSSRMWPRSAFVGLLQYERLWPRARWHVAIDSLMIFGTLSLIFSIAIGFLLAVPMDQKIRFEDTFRTIMPYPFALSFVVTGLAWQWILNPDFGIQWIVRGWGWQGFTFDPLNNPKIVVYGLLIAALWQSMGFVMWLMLAGLRGIGDES
jgi:glucose/mannose transport system permease protein